MIQAGLIVLIAAVIFGMGTIMGKKWEKAVWQPVYFTLAEKMTKLQSDLNLKNEVSKTETAKLGTELVIVAKESEIDYITMQAEVDRRVNDYLDKLAAARLQPLSDKTGDTGSGGSSGSLSDAPRAFGCPDPEGRFAGALDARERSIIKRLIKTRDNAINRTIACKDYLDTVEAKMVILRKKYEDTISSATD